MAAASRAKFIDRDQSGALGINLRHLHVLCAVADAGSIAHAADRLYRVSSAVARSISELEAVLDALDAVQEMDLEGVEPFGPGRRT